MKDHAHILMILDRSGSMDVIQQATIDSVNAWVLEQRNVGANADMTLVTFDDQYDEVYTATPIHDVPPLNADRYTPRGSTALFDAIYRAVTEAGVRLSTLPEESRPDKVVCVIVTDGFENSSRLWRKDQVFALIRQQEKQWNWQFAYLGANQDAMREGAGIGVRAAGTLSYAHTPDGMRAALMGTSDAVAAYRTGTSSSVNLSSEGTSDEVL